MQLMCTTDPEQADTEGWSASKWIAKTEETHADTSMGKKTEGEQSKVNCLWWDLNLEGLQVGIKCALVGDEDL